MTSRLPAATSRQSPSTRAAIGKGIAVVLGNHKRMPHDGHGASPGGREGSSRSWLPHTGQVFGSPSGVRDEMFMIAVHTIAARCIVVLGFCHVKEIGCLVRPKPGSDTKTPADDLAANGLRP